MPVIYTIDPSPDSIYLLFNHLNSSFSPILPSYRTLSVPVAKIIRYPVLVQ
jgi:hypothetical protein